MKNKLYEKTICLIYILIIFLSMYPNKSDEKNIANLSSIVPNIENVYEKKNDNKPTYSFKSIEIIKKIINL